MAVPPIVYLGALALALAPALLAWAVLGSRDDSHDLVTTNLERGQLTNLRDIRLAQPTSERTVEPFLAWLAAAGRRVTPMGSLARLERKLVLAGRPTHWPLQRVLAAKVLAGGIGLVPTLLLVALRGPAVATLAMAGLTVLLFMAPDLLLSARASERQRAILYALPDTLDQMTICMEAGLAFEAAMSRTSHSNADPLAQEIVRTLQDIQVGVGRREALNALAERSSVPDLRYFITAVLQAERYGVPITRVLSDQAEELRMKRRQRAEEAARKLPLKLLFPLILFVLPPVFIIVIGPAAIELMDTLPSVGG